MFGSKPSKVAGYATEADQYLTFNRNLTNHTKELEHLCKKHSSMLDAALSDIRVTLNPASSNSGTIGETFLISDAVAEQVRQSVLLYLVEEITRVRNRIDNLIHHESKQRS